MAFGIPMLDRLAALVPAYHSREQPITIALLLGISVVKYSAQGKMFGKQMLYGRATTRGVEVAGGTRAVSILDNGNWRQIRRLSRGATLP